MVCHKDIARELNITQSTVSRALDPRQCHLVAAKTREQVIATAQRLGFCSNIHARRTRTHRSEAVTLIMDSMRHPQVSEMAGFSGFMSFNEFNHVLDMDIISGVIDGAAELNYEVKLLPMHSRQELKLDFLRTHLQFPYTDGAIFVGNNRMRNFNALLPKFPVPQIMITNSYRPTGNIAQVFPEEQPGVDLAAHHLAQRQPGKIYFQALDMHCREVGYQFTRLASWKQALSRYKLPVEIIETRDKSEIPHCADQLLSTNEKFTILSANDSMAAAWMQELLRRQVAVPERVQLIGFDGNPVYANLSSVVIDYYQMGKQAARALVSAVKSAQEPHDDISVATTFKNGQTV